MPTRQSFSRRRLLWLAGAVGFNGAAAAGLAACGADAASGGQPPAAAASPAGQAQAADAQASSTPPASAAPAPTPPTAPPPAGRALLDMAARARESQGDIGQQPTAPSASAPSASAAGLTLPADLRNARASRLIPPGEQDPDAVSAWRNIGWMTNFDVALVKFDEIFWGGVPRDGIPPIDRPMFTPVGQQDDFLAGREPVIALEISGQARAYPLQILTYHEIVNDDLGGRPVAVTFCPLCNSSVVFDRELFGAVLRFGVSGNLRNSDLIMWDDLTETWWQQLTGEAIVGDLAGAALKVRPSQLIAYDEFTAAFPQGQVLTPDTGFIRSYGINPYGGYDSGSGRPFLFRGALDDRLRATERVVAVEIGGEAAAYAFADLRERRAVNDDVGGAKIVVFWTPDTASALGQTSIADADAVGSAVAFERVVDGRALTFAAAEGGGFADRETGSTWSVTGRALSGPLEGARLPPVVHANHFWFAWAAFKPHTRLYRPA